MKPRLLLSNDDGLDSPFLPAFAKALAQVADLKIVVPAREQSWVGRAYSRHSEVRVKREEFFGLDCQTITGTPSDCVNIALGHFYGDKLPDAVVSGMNIGQNIGRIPDLPTLSVKVAQTMCIIMIPRLYMYLKQLVIQAV